MPLQLTSLVRLGSSRTLFHSPHYALQDLTGRDSAAFTTDFQVGFNKDGQSRYSGARGSGRAAWRVRFMHDLAALLNALSSVLGVCASS